ncbi:unnamed protein product [Brassica oleracea var. botrytis]|uniref:FAD/NAD(P)-binding domain-containing protein n=2 Tax=Brassica TaxID=3705 RepID=A0A3P6FJ83_BRAOL|nr:unnamed protein product [Brassica napus]VDD49106.1 unnamed protein product [Brassica oleracea]
MDSNGKKFFDVDYDYLVIATGTKSNTFNIPGVEENFHFLSIFLITDKESVELSLFHMRRKVYQN